MLYLTCTTITIEDLAHYGVSRAKDSVFVDCGTIFICAVPMINGLGCSAGAIHTMHRLEPSQYARPVLSSYPKMKVLGFVTILY